MAAIPDTPPYQTQSWWSDQFQMPSIPGMDTQIPGTQASIPNQMPQVTVPESIQSQLQDRSNRLLDAYKIRKKINDDAGGLNVSAITNGAMTPEQIEAGDFGAPTIQNVDLPSQIDEKSSFGDKVKGFANSGIASGIGKAADMVNSIASSFGKDTTQGPNGDLRAGIDQGWNSLSDAAANFGPYGKMVSGAMKAVGALNSIQGAVFGATDNMTKKDAILDSPLGFLTGVGWVNQAFGSMSDTITKDEETFAQAGSSYGGTGNAVDEALEKSGKKYGAFSGAERAEANREISKAKYQQSTLSDIMGNASDRFSIRDSMSAINGNRRAFAMQGGYNQSAIQVGREGMIMAKRGASQRRIQERRKKINLFQSYLSSDQKTSLENIEDQQDAQKNFEEALAKGIQEIENMIEEFKEGGAIDNVSVLVEVDILNLREDCEELGVIWFTLVTE